MKFEDKKSLSRRVKTGVAALGAFVAAFILGLGLAFSLVFQLTWGTVVCAVLSVACLSYLAWRYFRQKTEVQSLIETLAKAFEAYHELGKVFQEKMEEKNIDTEEKRALFSNLGLKFHTGEVGDSIESFNKLLAFFQTIVDRIHNRGKCSLFETCFNFETHTNEKALVEKEKIQKELVVDWVNYSLPHICQASEKLTLPLSEEVASMKNDTGKFISELKRWQKLASENSDNRRQDLTSQFSNHTAVVTNLSDKIKVHNEQIQKSLSQILNKVELVFRCVGNIDEISEKVQMLSFNAAIEAARAGESGRGFKIISASIKDLSKDVQSLVKEISTDMTDMRAAIKSVMEVFNGETKAIYSELGRIEVGLTEYNDSLTSYQNEFDSLFDLIVDTTHKIDSRIDYLLPVFQSFDISLQETRHISEFSQKLSTDYEKMDEKRIRLNLVEALSKVATTKDEMDRINEWAKMNAPDFEAINHSTTGIELF